MTANMNFNAEWMRNDALPKRTSTPIGHRPDFLGSYMSSPQTPTMPLSDEFSRNPFKYSKNFMLNLYNPLAALPDDFEHHEHVVVEESQHPLAFIELSESEKKLLSGAVHSEPSRRNANNPINAAEKNVGVQRNNRDFFASPMHSPASEHAPTTPSKSTMRSKGRVDDYFSKRGDTETSKLRELSSSSNDLHEAHWGANGLNNDGDNANSYYPASYGVGGVGNGPRFSQPIMNDVGSRGGLYQGTHDAMAFDENAYQDRGATALGGTSHTTTPRWYPMDRDQLGRGQFDEEQMRSPYGSGYLSPMASMRREGEAQFDRLGNMSLDKGDPLMYSGGASAALPPHAPDRFHHGANSFNLFGARGEAAARGGPMASPYRFDPTSPSPEFFSQASTAPLRSPLPQTSLNSFPSIFPRENMNLPGSPSWAGAGNQNMPFGMPQQSPLFSTGLNSPGFFDYPQQENNPYDQYAALQQKHAMPFRQPNPSTPGWQSTPGTPGVIETPFNQWAPTGPSTLPTKISEERLQSKAPGQQSPRIPRSPPQPETTVMEEVAAVAASIAEVKLEESSVTPEEPPAPAVVEKTPPVAAASKPISLREIQAEEMKKQHEMKLQQQRQKVHQEPEPEQEQGHLPDNATLSLASTSTSKSMSSKPNMTITVPLPSASSPWGRETATKGPSLREIQELEAREAKARKAHDVSDIATVSTPSSETPLTMTWGVVVPNSKSHASIISTPSTPTTPAWGSTAAPKKTLREIQLEEEAASKRKANVRLASSTSTSTTGSQGYASVAGTAAKNVDLTGWTTVTNARPTKTSMPAPAATPAPVPATPTAAARPAAAAAAVTPTRTTTTVRNDTPKAPSDDFRRWCGMSLRNLNADVNADEFVQMLLSFPLGNESAVIIEEIVNANSTSRDGRRFADEFMKRKKADMAGKLSVPETTDDDGWSFQVVTKKGRKKQPQA